MKSEVSLSLINKVNSYLMILKKINLCIVGAQNSSLKKVKKNKIILTYPYKTPKKMECFNGNLFSSGIKDSMFYHLGSVR